MEAGGTADVDRWVDLQNERTRLVLDALPERARLHRRISELLKAGTVTSPVMAADRVFTLDRWGDLDQAVVMVRSATDATVAARPVVDPHHLAADHAAAVDWFSPSPDGRLLAYGTSEGGRERGTLRIVDVDSGEMLPDAIPHTRSPYPAWLPDGSGFAYSRLPDPADVPAGEDGYWMTVWWHQVGDDAASDTLVLGDLDRTAIPMATISPDGRWLAVHVVLMPTRTDVTLIDRHTGARTVVVHGEEASTWCQLLDDRLYAVTNLGSPRGRVVTAALAAPQVANWTTVVPEGDAVIDTARVAGENLLVVLSEHGTSSLKAYQRDGSGGTDVALPGLGELTGFHTSSATTSAFLSFASFERPSSLWRWTPGGVRAGRGGDAVGGQAGVLEAWSGHDPPFAPDALVVERVFYPSTDGAEVPMFVVRAASTEAGPDTPTVLGAYGGFAITSAPGYSAGLVAFCEEGGVYALAGIRGGGEYGEDWHRAGMLQHKQQVFDDFAAAGDWLVAQARTSPTRLGIRGGSNGGLLVGATLTQRPDLARAAVCAVPLLDMLRYHLFLIGALWVPEYGDPDRAEDFEWLHAYSPYHHVVDGTPYPATLVTTAVSDSRVDPMHARKFAARLQAATSTPDERPVLLRVEGRAGHGQGKPAAKQADEAADTWAFLLRYLGHRGGNRWC